ncbi:bifunctional adenosylcobinamide kinase/adenosylcobinamide-phosphate guanylyltransferase [Desulfosporosinus metallidurans]|uniref:Adenosylcobinamide kinase n=1 Tax=Desulfosporosinus metallidurans TaxID=1888891 RepID=A0A1Q8QRH9_9FIRM|nr:bifunctional adenosylcobinamide kinase/adenosylcobinamide-phosphate guanylyltransferase [Desulfosporosinus metallidurans]OLN29959.1 Adenosylcobinamide-phosphate guanylyltransferase [Desulfosporosinus metallidurans]
MSQFTLITGGARSGKSHFAELLAASAKSPVIYIATAQIWDDEMALRVKKHQQQRPSTWRLIEEPQAIRDTLFQLKDENGVILLDCVTLWLSNLLLKGQTKPAAPSEHTPEESSLDPQETSEQFTDLEPQIVATVKEVAQLAQEIKPQVIFVTNELGQGIVPEYPLARAYRDLVGRCNRVLAQSANDVYLVVAGFPIEIKHAGEKLLASLREE